MKSRFLLLGAVAALMLLMLVVPVGATEGPPLIDMSKFQVDIVYARSFESGESAPVIKVGFPVYEGRLLGKSYSVAADVLGFVDCADAGVGVSLEIPRALGKADLGVGWLPKDIGLSWYVGLKL
jgi:hypothetical protein